MAATHRIRPPAACHPERPHHARGLCTRCYYRLPEFKASQAAAQRRAYQRNKEKGTRRIKTRRLASCHPERREYSRRLSLCQPCHWQRHPERMARRLAQQRMRYHADPERARAISRKWFDANRERAREHQRQWRKRNPERARQIIYAAQVRRLERRFGISFTDLLLSQGGRCGICGTAPIKGGPRFHLDHDHQTGEARGILCSLCNTGIGALGDTVASLQRALAYLNRSPIPSISERMATSSS
jgi:hypothetical protein